MSASPLTITVALPAGFEAAAATLALGGELKSSICLISNGSARLSRAIGDLEQEDIYRHFLASTERVLGDCKAEQIVIDRHPDYLSTKYGQQRAGELNLSVQQVQHHYAHIAAVMADNGLPLDAKPVLGIALDGLGFGEDGTIWGGEFLLADYSTYQRLGRFQPVAMPGGAAAIHEPWRNTLAHLLPLWETVSTTYADTDIIRFLNDKPVAIMRSMLASGVNAPLASSCGRLFDAVAAAVGLCRDRVDCEAQAAIALEQAASACFDLEATRYNYQISEESNCLQLNWQPMWLELLRDIQLGRETGTIAARFHRTIINALHVTAVSLCRKQKADTIALSGGVFQNRLISTHLVSALQQDGFRVLQHHQVPTHDGGISLGQAVIAAAMRLKEKNR
ncbi:MAG: hypothetical protein COW18_05470 [Zetaproteobacteria bacterium CG12_big_fil_rev_8_21_14_0_65_54_13]|nr:MAG: hypothetical protein COW18_05470 [Zetaproteobacteria bacterium CG12_big_fil_rev_8_21_14_0_65_54_13]PIX54322.1 MAG: hypothetical protein COZ50_08410 [Zetaproteobacteria bacterium CG_4_10_14_3_um_filter_54_28]PJA28526.1 MAG: hypothetical protein CO188_09065 [Zetaproteobacteria bacterium CG_4_9_14_3_um_filter_54_145]